MAIHFFKKFTLLEEYIQEKLYKIFRTLISQYTKFINAIRYVRRGEGKQITNVKIINYHIIIPRSSFAVSIWTAIRLKAVASSTTATAATMEFFFWLLIDIWTVVCIRPVVHRRVHFFIFYLCHHV